MMAASFFFYLVVRWDLSWLAPCMMILFGAQSWWLAEPSIVASSLLGGRIGRRRATDDWGDDDDDDSDNFCVGSSSYAHFQQDSNSAAAASRSVWHCRRRARRWRRVPHVLPQLGWPERAGGAIAVDQFEVVEVDGGFRFQSPSSLELFFL
jgi:hypothetical protein